MLAKARLLSVTDRTFGTVLKMTTFQSNFLRSVDARVSESHNCFLYNNMSIIMVLKEKQGENAISLGHVGEEIYCRPYAISCCFYAVSVCCRDFPQS